MAWRIELDRAAQKERVKLDKPVARRIVKFLRERVAADSRRVGQALKDSELGEFWKYRVGAWRIIAHIEDDVLGVVVLMANKGIPVRQIAERYGSFVVLCGKRHLAHRAAG